MRRELVALCIFLIIFLAVISRMSASAGNSLGDSITLTPSPTELSPTHTPRATGTALPEPSSEGTQSPIPTSSPDTVSSTVTDVFSTETPTLTPSTYHDVAAPDDGGWIVYFPILLRQESPPTLTPTPTATVVVVPTTVVICRQFSSPLPIPDNNPEGLSHTIHLNYPGVIVDLDFYANISHTWVGDLIANLTHTNTSKSAILFNRPGYPAEALGCQGNDFIAILDDGASQEVEGKCAPRSPTISGTFKADDQLGLFVGESVAGDWRLSITDNRQADLGSLNSWCMDLTFASSLPPNPPTPTPTVLPPQTHIVGISGKDQSLPLDCESRSAVDWAAYFGVHIGELEFFNNLPKSDNPDTGFVGSVYGRWGQIPPNPYGVHAKPVADLLRNYGLRAYAHRYLSWKDVKAEIADGNPVIVWVIGISDGAPPGRYYPVFYNPSDGKTTVVSPYEHTAIVIGYTADSVTLLDGDSRYTRTLTQFLDSWSVLRNMAILTHP